jgi:hypothetical protein
MGLELSRYSTMHHRRSLSSRTSNITTIGILAAALAGLLGACTQVKPLKPEMSFQVQPAGSEGYTISGRTNLPNRPRILVQAIRRLRPATESSSKGSSSPSSYVVVAQQWVDTNEGNWQTTLKLRQPGVNGTSLESWQQQSIDKTIAMTAEQQVTFIAQTTPVQADLRLEGDSEIATNATLQSEVLKLATDGNRYLKAEQSMMIPPPQIPNSVQNNLQRAVIPVRAQSIAESGDPKKQKKIDSALSNNQYAR